MAETVDFRCQFCGAHFEYLSDLEKHIPKCPALLSEAVTAEVTSPPSLEEFTPAKWVQEGGQIVEKINPQTFGSFQDYYFFPKGWEPSGGPYLKQISPADGIVYYIYYQDLRSPMYPGVVYHIRYSTSIFKKFLQAAQFSKKAFGASPNPYLWGGVILYILERTGGAIPLYLQSFLDIDLATVYNALAILEQEGKIYTIRGRRELRPHIPTQIGVAPPFRVELTYAEESVLTRMGQHVYMTRKLRTLDELLEELRGMVTIEQWKATPEEWEEMKRDYEKWLENRRKESLLTYTPTPEEQAKMKEDLKNWLINRNKESLKYYS